MRRLACAVLALALALPALAGWGPVFPPGHLFETSTYTDVNGRVWDGSTYTFLYLVLPETATATVAIDYVQEVDYLVGEGYVLRSGAAISRTVWVTEGTRDVVLPLSKPCSPGETETLVGLVTVCPPREGNAIDACTWVPGVTPMWIGVPAETTPCPPIPQHRRAVRSTSDADPAP